MPTKSEFTSSNPIQDSHLNQRKYSPIYSCSFKIGFNSFIELKYIIGINGIQSGKMLF